MSQQFVQLLLGVTPVSALPTVTEACSTLN